MHKDGERTPRTRVGRVRCEVARQLHMLPEVAKAQDLSQCIDSILTQRIRDKNMLYALRANKVEYIISKGKGKGKGKGRIRCEFGVNV